MNTTFYGNPLYEIDGKAIMPVKYNDFGLVICAIRDSSSIEEVMQKLDRNGVEYIIWTREA